MRHRVGFCLVKVNLNGFLDPKSYRSLSWKIVQISQKLSGRNQPILGDDLQGARFNTGHPYHTPRHEASLLRNFRETNFMSYAHYFHF